MTRLVKWAVFLSCLAVPAVVTPAGIVGSKHDFSDQGWSGGRICVVCHTPHNANTSSSGGPLWNHQVTQASYTLYASPTMDATVSQPTSYSKLCLSCHDGTVAIDSFGGMTGSTTIGGTALLGTDLSDDHPISFTYDASLATTDGGLHDPASTSSGVGGGTIDSDMLFNHKLECSSCHDVHSKYNNPKLLVKNNNGSALCLTCHDK